MKKIYICLTVGYSLTGEWANGYCVRVQYLTYFRDLNIRLLVAEKLIERFFKSV